MNHTIFVTIGNSDNKLTQQEWAAFHSMVDQYIRERARTVYGAWYSGSVEPWQNAAWSFSLLLGLAHEECLRHNLALAAAMFRQDAIAWTSGLTQMIGPPNPPNEER